jgi:hypothetical protein
LARILKKVLTFFYKVIQKQIYDTHMVACHMVIFPAAANSTTHLPDAGAITAGAS